MKTFQLKTSRPWSLPGQKGIETQIALCQVTRETPTAFEYEVVATLALDDPMPGRSEHTGGGLAKAALGFMERKGLVRWVS